MIKLSLTRMGVAVGGLALSFTAGAAGVASADPDLGPFVNTTCSYPQVVSALNAQDPQAAAAFNSSPTMQSGLRQFLAAPPARRQQMAQQMARVPANQPYIGLLEQVFNTCNNY
jgi:hemophore-related protein